MDSLSSREKNEMKDGQRVPKVFISYSHDSPVHKRWVAEFASKLVENGVDVILDQWDLGPGDDIPKFVEHAVSWVDRVLMVCTESYVKKADEGAGGVGYEAMVVTGELVRDLGSSKFVPIIRQQSKDILLPRFASTRFYVNMSEGLNLKEQFELLLRELHQVPALRKPPLGKSPFSRTPSGGETPRLAVPRERVEALNPDTVSPLEAYRLALDVARAGDLVMWRKLIRSVRAPIPGQLEAWRKKYEGNIPKDKAQLPSMVEDAAKAYAPLMMVALAGLESGRTEFVNQATLVDEILHPRGWNWNGVTTIVNLPDAIAYIYQALHGAMCLETDQLPLARGLALMKIERASAQEATPLYRNTDIIGWPDSLGQTATVAWKFLEDLPGKWPWLNELFGGVEDYRAALFAYYLTLNVIELAETIASGDQAVIDDPGMTLEIPVCFLAMDEETKRKGYRLILANPDTVRSIWRDRGIGDEVIERLWPKWVGHAARWLDRVYNYRFLGRVAHRNLMADLK